MQGAGESSESDDDEGNSGFRSVLRARADSSPAEVGDSDEETPALGQSLGQGDEFARELAGTMSAIANLVVKATGRSVSNGGWLYFSGAREDYHPFRARCQLFQETYHGTTPPKVLVGMFREWNLSEESARHIKGAEDMKAAWGMLDAVYDGAPAQGLGVAGAPELQWMERGRVGKKSRWRKAAGATKGKGRDGSRHHECQCRRAGGRNRDRSAGGAYLHRHAARDQASEMPVGERRGAGAHSCEL